ncbi:D-glucuronyl C5-epimerase family protein [Pilimelia columellifera]|uniref:D-glucuronyl C5-epimerase C-terminal domain-containing protein n=1 Tax=Pilimelia columellifera subsp. columellifera TaxID=706583 RepID=A0ABN3NSH3_9ACTN
MFKGIVAALVLMATVNVGSPAFPVDAADYRRTDYRILTLPPDRLPYNASAPGPLDGAGTFDEHGIAMRLVGGRKFDHPVFQAQFMLSRLSSYRLNRDPRYLARVEAHAQRLLGNAVSANGAIYFPYAFDWALHHDTGDMMTAPWFSAMAQGQALSAFVRLHAITRNPRYATAAEKIFASFTVLRGGGSPWTTEIDAGYLWFEEYAKHPGPDRTYNGHIYAIYGLYDYFLSTRSATAKALMQGGITTVAAHLSNLRQPGWLSRYCRTHPQHGYVNYHADHVGQLYQLHRITGDATFAVQADRLIDDYPADQAGGHGYLAAGSHEALHLDRDRRTVATRTFLLPAAQAVTVKSRHRVSGLAGVWLQIGSGTAAGYWVRELHPRAFIKLSVDTHDFIPRRLVTFRAGRYVGFAFDRYGLRTTPKPFRLREPSSAHATRRTVMNGATYFLIADGVWAGRWVPAQPGLTLT